MRYTIILLFCLMCGFQGKAQTYNVVSDTVTCIMQFQTPASVIRVSIDLSELRYVDRPPANLLIFDGVSTTVVDASMVLNFANIAALKSRMSAWALQCENK